VVYLMTLPKIFVTFLMKAVDSSMIYKQPNCNGYRDSQNITGMKHES
jgi:hypothetical protein